MIEWSEIEWKQEEGTICHVQVKTLVATIPGLVVDGRRGGIGIDPGRNFGISAVRENGHVGMWYGYLHDRDWTYARDGYMAMDLMMAFGEFFPYPGDWNVVIEGSAFSKSAGEANLAMIREGFYIGAKRAGFPVQIVPPNKIRKAATGHGRTRMMELLPTVNDNAAAALACALFAAGYKSTPQ